MMIQYYWLSQVYMQTPSKASLGEIQLLSKHCIGFHACIHACMHEAEIK